MRKIILYFIIAGFIETCLGIECYICQSRDNYNCGDPIKLSKLELTECTPEVIESSSHKLAHSFNGIVGLKEEEKVHLLAGSKTFDELTPTRCQKISFQLGGENVVIRGCQVLAGRWVDTPSEICNALEKAMNHQHEVYLNYCNFCSENGCNSAPEKFKFNTWIIIISLVIVMITLR